MNGRRAPKKRTRKLARARVRILWRMARDIAGTQPELARRWVSIAREVAQRARVKLPRDMSRHICRRCGAVLIPGRSCRVRLRSNRRTHLTVTCLRCGTIRRFPVTRQR